MIIIPWEVKQVGSQFCVFKKGASEPLKGGCHATKAEARDQQKALYANNAMSVVRDSFIIPVGAFSETAAPASDIPSTVHDSANTYWVQAFRAGKFSHAIYGEITLNDKRFENFARNFHDRVTLNDLAIDYEHGMDASKGLQAAGWIHDIRAFGDRLDKLVEFTDDALREIRAKKWRYYSSEFSDVWERNDGMIFEDVIHGGGITNRPFLRGMAPLNLNEVIAETYPTKTREEREKIYIGLSEGYLPWEIEHGEPGSGSGEPIPRTDGDPDRAADNGWRRDTPPIVEELEDTQMNEHLKALALSLGITVTDDMDDAKLNELILAKQTEMSTQLSDQATQLSELNEELEPLRQAQAEADSRKTFRETFPKEWERMERMEARDRDVSAQEFSSNYERFLVDADKDERSTRGFSSRVLESIREGHKKLSSRQFGTDDLKGLLDLIASNAGIVDYGERGSSRFRETGITPEAGSGDARKQFAELVKTIMEEDNLDYTAAITEAAKRDPELANAYRAAPTVR